MHRPEEPVLVYKEYVMEIIGICLIILGGVALFYQGMTFIIPKNVIDLKFLTIKINETKTIPLPPVVGVVSLAIGIVMVTFF